MDGISRSRGWDKGIPHGVLPMEQAVLSNKWARIMCLAQGHNAVPPLRLNPQPFDLESSTLPLNHCTPSLLIKLMAITHWF